MGRSAAFHVLTDMTMNDSDPPKPKRLRRWYQFSLRTLLVFMLVCGAGLGWFAMKMQRAKRQQEAVEAILKVGGKVFYDYQLDETGAKATPPVWLRKSLGDDFFFDVIHVIFVGTHVTDAELENLERLTSLEWLVVRGRNVTDAGFEHLKGLTSLEELTFYGDHVTDAGLENLKGLTSLESLDLEDTCITGEAFEHLGGLTSLEGLHLWGTKVTDTGLERLKALTSVKSLDLSGTQVTDEGLEYLKGLTRLKHLYLRACEKIGAWLNSVRFGVTSADFGRCPGLEQEQEAGAGSRSRTRPLLLLLLPAPAPGMSTAGCRFQTRRERLGFCNPELNQAKIGI